MTNYYKDHFHSADLGLISALVVSGYKIESLDRSNPQKIEFFIKREDGLDEVVQAYWNHELRISPLAYWNAVKTTKNRIYSN